jgi:hypothetical protein
MNASQQWSAVWEDFSIQQLFQHSLTAIEK